MNLSFCAEYLLKRRPGEPNRTMEEAIELLHDAGFRYVDVGFTYFANEGNFIFCDDWKEKAVSLRKKADALGVTIDQTHAPFRFENFPLGEYRELMRRAFESSVILGAKQIVCHGDTYLPEPGVTELDFDTAFHAVTDFYDEYVNYAIQNKLTVCFEDLFDYKPGHQRFTGHFDEVLALVEHYNSPYVCVCWDFGHGRILFKEEQTKTIREVGSKIKATHVQDNYFNKDLHLPPFFGTTDWKACIQALKETGFDGCLTMEYVYGTYPDRILPTLLKLYYEIGQELLSYAESL